ncbi:hypothetical protein BST63_16365 [Bradyrhizobium canariense]|uniref:Transposase n=1 Tax=Bradyrhizobium canariense TaxID=255045 RepID=A0ABX3X2Z0_9BRAD|nr:hypothetical protein BST63_16365 [Bradyrhizobium canariense]
MKHRHREEHIGSSSRSARRQRRQAKLPFVDRELVGWVDQYGFGMRPEFSAELQVSGVANLLHPASR